MPFKSEAQRAYMHQAHPELAKRWEAETPADAPLPERVEPRARTTPVKVVSVKDIAPTLVNRRA